MNHLISESSSIQAIVVIMLLATSLSCYGDMNNTESTPLIEIFTSSQFPIKNNSVQRSSRGLRMEFSHYEIDQITQLQRELSRSLPNDAEQAKPLVLQRFQLIDAAVSQRLENTAKGLVKALHYGIDRTPAMVFDGQAVIYGVIDVDEAAQRYRQWRERNDR